MEDVDRALFNSLKQRFDLGLFDPKEAYAWPTNDDVVRGLPCSLLLAPCSLFTPPYFLTPCSLLLTSLLLAPSSFLLAPCLLLLLFWCWRWCCWRWCCAFDSASVSCSPFIPVLTPSHPLLSSATPVSADTFPSAALVCHACRALESHGPLIPCAWYGRATTPKGTDASAALSLKASQQSIVLLRNDEQLLPLQKGKRVCLLFCSPQSLGRGWH
jgi:hypothetical protein